MVPLLKEIIGDRGEGGDGQKICLLTPPEIFMCGRL